MTDLGRAVSAAASAARRGPVVFSTGAGISAESGIPTFRGPEGYWTVGSRVYRPEELATAAAFAAIPDESWRWYLWRRGVCRAAAPNPAHLAIAGLEARLAARPGAPPVVLVTQNVDGLHRRAGSGAPLEIHGNLDHARCAAACGDDARWALDETLVLPTPDAALAPALAVRLVCPRCGGRARPHVLWFDECYDEPRYRANSALAAAAACALLVTIGTSAATNLPHQMVELAVRAGATLIDVNPEGGPFASRAATSPGGVALRAGAAASVPALCDAIAAEP